MHACYKRAEFQVTAWNACTVVVVHEGMRGVNSVFKQRYHDTCMQTMGLVFPEETLASVPGGDKPDLAQTPQKVYYTTDAIYNFYNNCKKRFKEVKASLKDNCPHYSSGREYTPEEMQRLEEIDKSTWHLWSTMFIHHGDDPALNNKGFCSRMHNKKVQEAKQRQQV